MLILTFFISKTSFQIKKKKAVVKATALDKFKLQ